MKRPLHEKSIWKNIELSQQKFKVQNKTLVVRSPNVTFLNWA